MNIHTSQNHQPKTPILTYADVIMRIDHMQELDKQNEQLNPDCSTKFFGHGNRVPHAMLILHGFTSCPKQFEAIGQQFHGLGFNVFIPRLPKHGHRNLAGDSLAQIKTTKLTIFSQECLNITAGLGDKVIVVGISGGATLVAWLYQHFPTVTLAVLIAPFLGVGSIPSRLNRAFSKFVDLLPNVWLWWDPVNKMDNPLSASYAYKRYPTRSIAEIMRLSQMIINMSKSNRPAGGKLILINNDADKSVNNQVSEQLLKNWQAFPDVDLQLYRFEAQHSLPHDVITPVRPDAKVDLVYPRLIELITKAIQKD